MKRSRFLAAIAALLLAAPAAIAGEYSSASAEASHTVTGGHRVLLVFGQSSGAGYLMTFDASAVPADGAVTPKECIPLTQVGSVYVGWHEMTVVPDNYGSGLSVAISSTGCFTKTTSPTGFLFLRYV